MGSELGKWEGQKRQLLASHSASASISGMFASPSESLGPAVEGVSVAAAFDDSVGVIADLNLDSFLLRSSGHSEAMSLVLVG